MPCFAQTEWYQKDFILGTFYDPPCLGLSIEKDSSSFQLAKDAYFNLLTGTQENRFINHEYDGMVRALSIASKLGLFYLVSDNRYFQAYDHPFDSINGVSLITQYRNLATNERNALYGYNLGDEPHFNSTHLENISSWKWFIESSEPHKLVYLNLVGSFAADNNWGGFKHGNKDGSLDKPEMEDYEQYLTYYIDSLRPAVVSFDHYPFFKNGTVRRDYFYNLAIVRAKAGLRPFWAYPMTVGHYDYIDPNEAHLYFMFFCPLAYGAKGLIAFTFWPPSENGFRTSLFDRNGNKTLTYEIVKRINLYVKKVVAPVVMNVQNIAVYHVTNFPNQQQWMSDTLNQNSKVIASIGNDQVMAGVFKNLKHTYLFIVNKDLTSISNIEIVLKGKIEKVWLAPSVVDFDEITSLSYTEKRTIINIKINCSTFILPTISGGEGRMIRIQ